MCFYMLKKKSHSVTFKSGETYRAFIAGIFRTHKMRVRKMKKFVARWDSLFSKLLKISFFRSSKACTSPPSVRYMHKSGSSVPNQAEARHERLRKLPETLRARKLNSMANKLERTFSDIKQRNPDCFLIWRRSAVLGILPTWYYYWTVILIFISTRNECWITC